MYTRVPCKHDEPRHPEAQRCCYPQERPSSDARAGGLLQAPCGTARRVWNWALEEGNKRYAAGRKPNAMAMKKQFNAIKRSYPQWLDEKRAAVVARQPVARPFAAVCQSCQRKPGIGSSPTSMAGSHNGPTVASPTGKGGTGGEKVSVVVGEITPVRYEYG